MKLYAVQTIYSLTGETDFPKYFKTREEATTEYNKRVEELKSEIEDFEEAVDADYVDLKEVGSLDCVESWFSSDVVNWQADTLVRFWVEDIPTTAEQELKKLISYLYEHGFVTIRDEVRK